MLEMIIGMALALIAWPRGWKAWGLLPALVLVGIWLAANQGLRLPEELAEALVGPLLIVDLGCLVALTFMAACGRAQRHTNKRPLPALVSAGRRN
jgi:hypothetical protein